MWTDVASFNGSVLVLNVEINGQLNLNLSCFDYQEDRDNFTISTQKRQTFGLLARDPRNDSLTCLGFKVLFDRHCGIFLPFFIAQVNDNIYLFCLDSFEWVVKYFFEMPKVSGQKIHFDHVMDLTIANGPTLIWIAGDEVFIYNADSFAKSRDCLLRLIVDRGNEMDFQRTGKILWWENGPYFCDSKQGLIVFKGEKLPEITSYLVILNRDTRKASIHRTKSVIPAPYLPVMTSCTVWPNSSFTTKKSNSVKVSCRVFVCTSQGQIVEFFEGQHVKHLTVPLSCCQNIKIFENYIGDPILLCIQPDQVCVVDWKTCKILGTWTGFQTLLIDDFVGRGLDQVLLFSGSEASTKMENLFEEFILLDFLQGDVIETKVQKMKLLREHDASIVRPEETSMDEVMNALMFKVKAAEVTVTECEMEKSEKLSFIKKHCEVLQDILMNTKHASESVSLASLLVGPKISINEGRTQCSKLAVLSKWQNLHNFQWAVGVDVENVGGSTISDISLSLVNKTTGTLPSCSKSYEMLTLVYQSNEVEHNLLNNIPELTPGQKLTVTTTSRIPDFTGERHFTGGLLLSWRQKDDRKQFAQFFGEVVLSIDGILNQEQGRLSQPRACPRLALCLLETQVLVSTSDKNRLPVELLKSKMDVCQDCSGIVSSNSKNCLRIPNLDAVHVGLTMAQNGLILDIFTRDHSQLYLTLGLLKQILPDDVTWTALNKQKLIDLAINSINGEVISSVRSLDYLLRSEVQLADELPERGAREELSVKRRRLSQPKDAFQNRYVEYLDLRDCLVPFSDCCSEILKTEQTFKSIFSGCLLNYW